MRFGTLTKQLIPALLLACIVVMLPGCFVGQLAGAIGQNIERYKKIEVLPEYYGLENKTVAVVVQCDPSILYEHSSVYGTIAMNVSRRIQENVPGAKVLDYRTVMQWQYQTPTWSMLPYGELADKLGVERVVFIEVYEFRLNPPGNRYLWDGACAATVGIIEQDGWDTDSFAKTWEITSKFPDIPGVGRESATSSSIQMGVLAKFVDQTAWLFYRHIEDKYPDAV